MSDLREALTGAIKTAMIERKEPAEIAAAILPIIERREREAAAKTPEQEIRVQRRRNHEKWGDQSIELRSPSYQGWLPTLGEEFGEVCRARTLESHDVTRLRAELIDLAAVALMWIDSIDREVTG